jgi:hypothetical protein
MVLSRRPRVGRRADEAVRAALQVGEVGGAQRLPMKRRKAATSSP